MHNVRVLRPFAETGIPIIATEPTAALFLRDEYLDLLGKDAAEAVSDSVYDACSFIEKRLTGADASQFAPLDLHVAYHAPCHLKAMRIGRPAVALLRRIPSLRVTTIEEGCCGMAGTYGMKRAHYETSMAIGKGLFARLADPSVQFGATDCSTCKLQMEHGSDKMAIHPLKLVARSMGAALPLA
jgi:Fe-S oxidoreductase